MKNLINIYILLLLVVCSTLSSCSDWLDVNNNPNTAEKVEAGYLFNYAAVNWSGNRIGGDSYIPFSQFSRKPTEVTIMVVGAKLIMLSARIA